MALTERSAPRSLSVEIDGSTEPYLKPHQLAPILNVKPRTITDWANRFPDFPRLSLPGSIRIRASEVIGWLKDRNKSLTPPLS